MQYLAPKGTRVAVAEVAARGRMKWKPHTLRRALHFDLLLKSEGEYLVFQHENWYIYAPSCAVRRVEPTSS